MDVNMEKPDWEQYTQVIDSIDIFHWTSEFHMLFLDLQYDVLRWPWEPNAQKGV